MIETIMLFEFGTVRICMLGKLMLVIMDALLWESFKQARKIVCCC